MKLEQVGEGAANEWIMKESLWATVNYSVASKTMEDVFNNYPKYKQIGEKARLENKKTFSLESMDKEFDILLNRYVPNFPKKVEVILPKFKKKV